MAAQNGKWQGWAIFTLGLWLAVSPWLAAYAESPAATANAVILGLAVAIGSHFECVACDEAPAEWLNLGAGIWLVLAPLVLELGPRAASVNSVVVGTFVVCLSASALSLDKRIGRLLQRAH